MRNLRKLKQSEWNQLYMQLMAVEEAEADFGRPIGEHYNLANLIARLLNVRANKEDMKQIAQEVLDNGYDPD